MLKSKHNNHYTNMCPNSLCVSLDFDELGQIYDSESGPPLVNKD